MFEANLENAILPEYTKWTPSIDMTHFTCLIYIDYWQSPEW
ncbi:MAG: hypothetical protein AAFR81_25970 [Chloroflexota bacterium]